MKRWTRWEDWIAVVAGAYMLFVPLFTLDRANDATIWAAEVLGGLILLGALAALAWPNVEGLEALELIFGVALFVAPWVLDYADLGGAAWNAWVVGALVALLSIGGDVSIRTHRGQALQA